MGCANLAVFLTIFAHALFALEPRVFTQNLFLRALQRKPLRHGLLSRAVVRQPQNVMPHGRVRLDFQVILI